MTALAALVTLALLLAPLGYYSCCCVVPGTLRVFVRGCAGAVLTGRTITITETGDTGASAGAGGSFDFTLPPGTYNATTDAATHYNTGAGGPVTVTAGVTSFLTVTLTPVSGYSCSCEPCYPGNCATGPAPFVVPTLPTTLTGNDGVGSMSMTKMVTPPGGVRLAYQATVTRTAANARGTPMNLDALCSLPPDVTSVGVPVVWTVLCDNAGAWTASCFCYDEAIKNPGGFVCGGVGNCSQITSTTGSAYTAYPAQVADPACVSITYNGNNTVSVAGGSDLNAGSATVGFESGAGATLKRRMPYQIYGATTGFSWTV